MIVIRPIELKDREAFAKCANSASVGITNLPKNPELLDKKMQISINSFKKNVSVPGKENYVFVLENLETGEIGGTCSISAKVGAQEPLNFYKIELMQLHSKHPASPKEMRILTPVKYANGSSEICALYLMPHFRAEGLGKLLSFSRFLFIASHRHRFENKIMVEMRGVIDDNDVAPFWEGIGRKFLDIDFIDLMHLLEFGREFVADIMPRWPIYVSILPQSAQDVIGKTHVKTAPAFSMLTKEGFYYTSEVDVFDGGPKIEAKTESIRTVASSQVGKIDSISNDELEDGIAKNICNNRIDYRACCTKIKSAGGDRIILSRMAAEALQVKAGDTVRYAAT